MKKYLLLFSLLFLWHPTPAHAQWFFMSGAGCSAANTGAGNTVSCTVNNTLGRAQIVAVKWCDTDTTCTVSTSSDTIAITDTSGNSYPCDQRLDSASGTDRRGMAVCHTANIAANASNAVTLTVTSGNTVQLAGLIVNEVSGGTASFIQDAEGTLDVAATASPATVVTTGATVRGNELIYTFINIDAGTLAVGQPSYGGMGTNYFAGQLGTPTITGSGTTAMAEWNNASPRNNVKRESMSFNAPGFTLNPTAQQRGIIVTYYSPAQEAPTSLTFSNQPLSTTSPSQTITITNTGTGNLNFRSNATLSGTNAADFAVSGASTCVNGANVAVGKNCSIILTFTPSAAGSRTATVSINTNAAGAPHTASLTGNGMLLNGQVTISTSHP